ncbi:DUF222 domain-containing protein [Kribbella sp. WER1]
MDKAPEVMSEQELVHALDENAAARARLGTERLRLLAALDKIGYAERVGARDTVQFIEYRYRLDHHRARRDVQLARALPKYEAVTSKLDEGRLHPAQAEAIVLELEKTPSTVPVADLEVAEQQLARLTHLPPAQLRKAAIQARDILDTDGPEPEERKAAARESLTLCSVDRGVKFKGYLANENAELFQALITVGARPHKTADGDLDPRSREKRQADALSTTLTLAATALDAGAPSPTIPRPTTPTPTTPTTPPATTAPASAAPASTPPATPAPTSTPPASTPPANIPPTSTPSATTPPASAPLAGALLASPAAGVSTVCSGFVPSSSAAAEVVVDAAAPRALTGVGGGSRGSSVDVVPGFGAKANITVTIDLRDLQAATADAIGQTAYGPGLSAATIRRLACDANVIPVVLGSRSEPLDVGRRERLVTKGIRRALNTRDRGCVVCAAPPVMCDAHHLMSWIDGGATKLDNLVLLCRRHHTDLHNGHWNISIADGIVHVDRPSWADPPPPTAPNRTTTTPPADPRAGQPNDAARQPNGSAKPLNERAQPAPSPTPARASRWKSDEQTLTEAARFAVWGNRTATDLDTGPPSFATI